MSHFRHTGDCGPNCRAQDSVGVHVELQSLSYFCLASLVTMTAGVRSGSRNSLVSGHATEPARCGGNRRTSSHRRLWPSTVGLDDLSLAFNDDRCPNLAVAQDRHAIHEPDATRHAVRSPRINLSTPANWLATYTSRTRRRRHRTGQKASAFNSAVRETRQADCIIRT